MRVISAFAVLAWSIVATLSFSPAASSEQPAPKVGVILPLSGVMAEWGRSIQLGIEFGTKNADRQVQYIFEDEAACDAKKAVSAAQKLISIDKVSLVLTGCLNGTMAVLPIAKKADVLVVSLGLVNEELASQNRDGLITPSASITAEADGISKLLKQDGRAKLAVLRVEDNFTEEIMRGLKNYAERDGWKLVTDERLTFDTVDFRPSLLKVSKMGADAVLVYSSTEQVVSALRQMKELKIASLAPYAGYVIEADPPAAKEMEVLNGVRYAAAVTPVDDELSRHLLSLKSKETFQTRVAADLAADIGVAVKDCSQASGRSVCYRTSLTARKVETPAFSGAFSYDQNGLASREVRGKIVKDNKFEWVG
jgi:ABC-type branched-subunit amino acid transport system substrate-binding protein